MTVIIEPPLPLISDWCLTFHHYQEINLSVQIVLPKKNAHIPAGIGEVAQTGNTEYADFSCDGLLLEAFCEITQ